jgi:hypothetical protein
MSSFEFVAALLLLAAILGIANHRYLHLPRTIALMAGSLVLSVIIILVDRSVDVVELREWWQDLVASTDLPHVFLDCWPSCCLPVACTSMWIASAPQLDSPVAGDARRADGDRAVWFPHLADLRQNRPAALVFRLGRRVGPDRSHCCRRIAQGRRFATWSAGGRERGASV